jgi:glycosyltransferase involved in cell wall biosynthesis
LDVVNIQYESAAFKMSQLIHFLPRLVGQVPVVTTFHDLLVPYLFPKAGALRFKAVLTLARNSDGVIVTNLQDEQRLTAEGGINCLANIPIGSNIAAVLPPNYVRAAWRTSLNISADTFLVGYFGFMNATKGVDTLIEALAQMTPNTHLLMIGGRTGSSDPTNIAYAEQIDTLIAQHSLGSRIHWTRFLDDSEVSTALSACDAVALPYKDGVSLRRGTFMAALAHGCAIVTTQPQVDMPEVQDHSNVLLVPANSPEQLADALRELEDNRELRAGLQVNARALASNFTWDRIAARTVEFYEQIIKRDRQGSQKP